MAKYSTRQIKDDYTYTVEQVADLYRVDVSSVRRWISKEGLRRIPQARPHLVHSTDLRAFIEAKSKKRKHTCQAHEVFCFRCQEPRIPAVGSASIIPLPNTSIRFQAKCGECGAKMNRALKGASWDRNHPLAAYLPDASMEYSGVKQTPRECSLQREENHA